MTGIPFTQYLRPDGREAARWIVRPEDIEAAAQRFIDAGGNYTAEILRAGEVSVAAVKRVDGELRDVEAIVCANDFEVPAAVDKLVLLSVAHIGKADRNDNKESAADPASESGSARDPVRCR